jgi:hypothetical protein
VVVRFRLKVEELIGCGWREDVEASETVVRGSRTGSITTSETITRISSRICTNQYTKVPRTG